MATSGRHVKSRLRLAQVEPVDEERDEVAKRLFIAWRDLDHKNDRDDGIVYPPNGGVSSKSSLPS